MRKILVLLTLSLFSVALAQYEPTIETELQVAQAADFTDGIVVDCNTFNDSTISAVEVWGDTSYLLCVDTSMTRWDEFQLIEWSVYGLSDWIISIPWTRQDFFYATLRFNLVTEESLAILFVPSQGVIIYIVGTIN